MDEVLIDYLTVTCNGLISSPYVSFPDSETKPKVASKPCLFSYSFIDVRMCMPRWRSMKASLNFIPASTSGNFTEITNKTSAEKKILPLAMMAENTVSKLLRKISIQLILKVICHEGEEEEEAASVMSFHYKT